MSQHLRDAVGTPVFLHRVDSEAAYRERARIFLVASGGLPVLRERAERPDAYVSAGAWVVQCACGNGCSAHPGEAPGWPDPVAICFECGALYRPVFPPERRAVEEVLLARPNPNTRHFFPTDAVARRHGAPAAENVAMLRRENRAFGHPLQRPSPGEV